jgi:hypothetical protein
MEHLSRILNFVLQNLLRIWPILLASVPLAVLLRLSGVSERIRAAFSGRPVVAIFLATVIGAFAPFCACSVVPVIASMLIGGVPLAPVMSFWLASPSMDPEIFFLSVATLGWSLAVARLVATLLVSWGGGLLTLFFERRGWLGVEPLRLRAGNSFVPVRPRPWPFRRRKAAEACGCAAPAVPACGCETTDRAEPASKQALLWRAAREAASSTVRVLEFILIALVLEAVIIFYVPREWIVAVIGVKNPFAPALAALVGVPMYMTNVVALPLVGGLMTQGMNPGAALAFLIAGPMTCLPEMAAVWGMVKPRVFALYVGIALFGAILLGYGYSWVASVL